MPQEKPDVFERGTGFFRFMYGVEPKGLRRSGIDEQGLCLSRPLCKTQDSFPLPAVCELGKQFTPVTDTQQCQRRLLVGPLAGRWCDPTADALSFRLQRVSGGLEPSSLPAGLSIAEKEVGVTVEKVPFCAGQRCLEFDRVARNRLGLDIASKIPNSLVRPGTHSADDQCKGETIKRRRVGLTH